MFNKNSSGKNTLISLLIHKNLYQDKEYVVHNLQIIKRILHTIPYKQMILKECSGQFLPNSGVHSQSVIVIDKQV